MKKILFSAIVGMVLFTSCKRDWNCTCTNGSTTAVAETYVDTSKKDAKSDCDTYDALAKTYTSGISCKIEKK